MKSSIVFGPGLWQKLGKNDRPKMTSLIEKSAKILASYQPSLGKENSKGERKLSFTAAADDPEYWPRIKTVKKLVRGSTIRVVAVYTDEPSPEELRRARAIHIRIKGEGIDEHIKAGESIPLNDFAPLCSQCRRPDLERISKPYIVNMDPRRKTSQDIFECNAGMLIVRQRLHDALVKALGDDVEWGPARCVDDRGDEEPLWFMRPRNLVPPEECQQVRKQCPKCKEPTEIRYALNWYNNGKTAQLLGDKGQLTAFPKKEAHIYRAEWFFGDRADRGWGGMYSIYISGPLWAAFRDFKIEGIKSIAMQGTRARENPFRDDARPLVLGQSTRPAKTPPALSAKERAAIARLPWDQKDGYVYFELRSKNLAFFDPMMGGEGATYFEVPKFVPGVYRLPVSAIRGTDGNGADVDSACLVFVDAAYQGSFVDAFDFERYRPSKRSEKMLVTVAEKIGCRFAICPALEEASGCDFLGDGCYTLDLTKLVRY